MRMAVLAGAAAVSLAGAAIAAPVGAPQDAAMQAGAWGADGWQAGAATPVPAAAQAMTGQAMTARRMTPPPPSPLLRDYRPVHPGQKLKGEWRDPALVVADWRGWGLGAPAPGMRWIRYYDDAVLLDDRDRVVDARGPIAWDVPRGGWHGPHRGPIGGMDGGWHHPPVAPGVTSYRTGPNTVVTTRQVLAPPPLVYGAGYADDGYDAGYGYGGGSTVIVTPGVITTTTTTTTERVWHDVPVRAARSVRSIRSGKLVRR